MQGGDLSNMKDPSLSTEMSIVKGLGKVGDSIYTNHDKQLPEVANTQQSQIDNNAGPWKN